MNYLQTTKEERRRLLTLSYEDRLLATQDLIQQVIEVAKHPIIQFSGGADSCVMADIIHKLYPSIPCVFNDWGLFLPEQEEFCKKFFEEYGYAYLISRSGIKWEEFLPKNGFPIFKGTKFIPEDKYKEFNISKKCRNLKDICWSKLRKLHPVDYYFVGMLADESPQRKSLFINYGFVIPKSDGSILVKPIILLTKKEVFEYLKKNKIMYPKEYYKDTYQGKTFSYNHCDMGCFICGIRLNEYGFGRIGRLARTRPDIWFKLLDIGLRETFHKIIKAYPRMLENIPKLLEEYDKPKITGYDLDGVIGVMPVRDGSYFSQTKAERDSYEKSKRSWFLESPVIWNPSVKGFIITGRREKYKEETRLWLIKNSINYQEIYYMVGSLTFDNILAHKLKYLKLLKIERYFEDDIKLVKAIRKALPNIEVIYVPRTELTTKKLK
jgi:3'-phosphoadenosine 5'-phosphosulfate sulfotransferase (PAPS reductase)/FAD synthetase